MSDVDTPEAEPVETTESPVEVPEESGSRSMLEIYESMEAAASDSGVLETEAVEQDSPEPENLIQAAGESSDGGIAPPEHWSQEHQEIFANLPPEGQEFVLARHKDMERDYTSKTQSLANERRQFQQQLEAMDQVSQIWEPLSNVTAAMGLDPIQTQRQAAAWLSQWYSDPQGTVQLLAQAAGVDLGQQGEAEDEFADPRVKSLEQQVHDLSNQLQSTAQAQQQQLTQQQQAAQEARLQSLVNDIQTFAELKGNDGQLLHPHFEKVKQDMGALMQMGRADSLESAYEQAVKFQGLDKQPAAERVRRAKKAASSVQGRGGPATVDPRKVPRVDRLSQLYDQLEGK